ncbi:MAG: hypothetical protein JW832_14630 [Deltaproteobacteria bacterium]|nr:hypothetical protein [Deltaproteobacteria bacterium]
MVRGLDLFKDYFKNFTNQYVLIGGAACTVVLEEAGLDFRATKDLDIVLCVEALNSGFVEHFWGFIKKGGYKNQKKSTGKRLFYRFDDPEDASYPMMLELFSRMPDTLSLSAGSHLTPISVDEQVASLSAILLDDDYYRFMHEGKQEIDGLSVVSPQYLIPLKARAWLDLTGRRDAGEHIDDKDIRKHKNDVFKLFRIITPADSVVLPGTIGHDLGRFLDAMAEDTSLNLPALKLRSTTLEDVLVALRKIYGINS